MLHEHNALPKSWVRALDQQKDYLMANTNLGTVRNLSVRLPQDAFDNVVALAKVEGITMGEVIRRAIALYAETQMADPDWANKVESLQKQLAALLPPKA